jgi:hypothetical protein
MTAPQVERSADSTRSSSQDQPFSPAERIRIVACTKVDMKGLQP